MSEDLTVTVGSKAASAAFLLTGSLFPEASSVAVTSQGVLTLKISCFQRGFGNTACIAACFTGG